MGRPGKAYGGPWWGEFRNRLRFESDVGMAYPTVVGRRAHQPGRIGWQYTVTVEVPHDGIHRSVDIFFPSSTPRVPKVTVDGPTDSPHRYKDGTLCIWYKRDHLEHRWVHDDGLVELIDHIVLHLFKEEWWRETGEWLGPQISHEGLKQDD